MRIPQLGKLFPLRRAERKAASDETFWTREDVRFGRGLPRTSYAYGRDVREGLESNVIMAPVNWIMRTFTEAEPVVESRDPRDVWRPVRDHALTELLATPNPFYDGDTLWKATLISYVLNGNGYWLIVRNAFGTPVELWYAPHWLLEPKWDERGRTFITHYEYRPERGALVTVPVRDVVHFRFGLDPRNPRLGYGPLRSLLREVFTDEEASNFSAAILANMGVPGGLIAPKDISALPSADAVQEMKDYMKHGFTGDRRGEWLVLGTPTDVQQFGFDPNQLMLANLRDIAEERVCAILGIPAAVIGFGAGLQQTKVGATMRELRRLAWVQCIMPMQSSLAKQVSRQLLPQYVKQVRRFRVTFDLSTVSAFQEEETERATRIAKLVEAGIMRVDHAQAAAGLEVDETQAVYLRNAQLTPVPAEEDPVPAEPAAPANGNGQGDLILDEEELRLIRARLAPFGKDAAP